MDLFVQYRDEYTNQSGLIVTPGVVQRIKQFWYLSAGVELGIKTEQLDWQQEINRASEEALDTILPSFSTQELSVGPMLSMKRNSNKSQIEFILKGTWNQLDKMQDEVSLDSITNTNTGRAGESMYVTLPMLICLQLHSFIL